MTYAETLSWLFQQFPAYHLQGVSAYKPSLANIEALAAAFGNPEQSLRFVHVAGTNGKGSVSNMLASVFTESGERTGLFTSPHIHDFRERIRINGECISEQFVIDFCEKVRGKDLEVEPSFFEITWLMALCYFHEQQCSMVVAETGLGGRLDATNIIVPEIAVITNISLDHTNILGNTRPVIAREKAGIIKSSIPVVLGQADDEILPVIRTIAEERNAPIRIARSLLSYPAGIIGYQQENFDTVSAVIGELNGKGYAISATDIEKGIRNLRRNTGFFGRMEVVGYTPLILLDCAHNAAGISKMLESIPLSDDRQLHIVYGTSSDKDLEEIRNILPTEAHYYFTVFSNPRTATREQLEANFGKTGKSAFFFDQPLQALEKAKLAATKADTILIFGSFFLASDFFEVFFD